MYSRLRVKGERFMDDLLLGASELLPGTEDLPVTLIGGLVAWKRGPC